MSRIVIKIGTTSLTNDCGPPNPAYIDDLASQVAKQIAAGHAVILVSSGAIRAGMSRLNLAGRPRTIPQKQAAAAVGQGLLMHLYSEAFNVFGIAVAQVLLTKDDLQDRTRYLNARNTFYALLKAGAVPIVNENDTVAVDEIKFGDNDTLAALVSSLVEAETLLLLSDVDGLYDHDPTQFPDAQLIPVVNKIDREIEQRAGGARSTFGTGGMTTKIQAARICVRTGVRMVIAHGRRVDVIADALAGRCGTQFMPSVSILRPRQRWIVYGSAAKGTLTVNEGAKMRVVAEGKSLLPAGIVEVTGRFEPGDLVRITDSTGNAFARGFVNYGAAEVTRIMGRKTSEIISVLGNKPSDEVIHRDNLVLEFL